MKLIVGLGNPGGVYAHSRHNIGFLTVKALAKHYHSPFKRDSRTFSLSAKGEVAGQNLILALPLTFMNLSGNAIRALRDKYKIDSKSLLVVCDDLDLEFGRIKIKAEGSSGGHRGLESVIKALGSRDFARLRIGIGRPRQNFRQISDYVLGSFLKKEQQGLKEVIARSCSCCECWAKEGIAKSMDIFNQRSKENEKI